jgi:hypothetical protein
MMSSDSLDLVGIALACVKFLGAIVSGVSAIYAAKADSGTQPSEARSGSARGTKKQTALVIAVVGLVVAVLSQFVETLHDAAQAREDNRRYSEEMQALETQGRLANKTLDSIQQMLTSFDTFAYESEFDLPATDPRVAALIGELHELAQQPLAGRPPAGFTMFNAGNANATIGILPFDWTQPALQQLLPSLTKLSALWQAMPLRPGIVWINRSPLPIANLTQHQAEGTDLFFFNCNLPTPPNPGGLFYYEREKKLFIRAADFHTSASVPGCWHGETPMASIHGISAAQFVTEVDWTQSPVLDPLLSSIRPDYIQISVGHSSVFLYNLKTIPRKGGTAIGINPNPGFYIETTIPTEQEILDYKAAKPPKRMTGE